MALEVVQVESLPIDDVVALYRSAGWWKEGENPDGIPDALRGSFAVAAAYRDGALVGMARVLSDGHSDAYIQDVVVLAAHRGAGIGSALVAFCRDLCMAHGIRWVGLIGEPGTQAFYRRLGFSPMEGYVPMLHRPGEHRSEGGAQC